MKKRLNTTVTATYAKLFTPIIVAAAIYNDEDCKIIDFEAVKGWVKMIELSDTEGLTFNYFDHKITVDRFLINVFSIEMVELQKLDENE